MSEKESQVFGLEQEKKKLESQLNFLKFGIITNKNPFGLIDAKRTSERISQIDELLTKFRMEDLSNESIGKKLPVSFIKLGDIVITPGASICIGDRAISDKTTFNSLKDVFEKNRTILTANSTPQNTPPLKAGQFSSGLKFIYAMVKYINHKKINPISDTYEVSIDKLFISFFKESERLYSFIAKSTTDQGPDIHYYWTNNRHYAKKILTPFSSVSILNKRKGTKDAFFKIKIK